MPISVSLIRKIRHLDPNLQEVILAVLEEIEHQRAQMEQQVTKAEFAELREEMTRLTQSVRALAEAQQRTEERINELAEAQQRTEERINELTEAQKRTEERLGELTEAQKRTEERVDRLEMALQALAEAQQRTEERLNELAEAQQRTEERLNELAEAQKRTEEELKKLAAEHRITRERLEGVSNAVGYTLEDRAFRSLPDLLRRHGVEVTGRLVRKYVLLDNKERQINIYGHGRQDGQPVLILGEAKVRPSRKEVNRFLRLARRLQEVEGKRAFLLFVAYDFPPSIESYVREQGILPVWSYELEL